ncbi:MAG: signal recognition particle receptor subunit alpha [Nanoarchaeota archaeon]|nr:signal recognition particle receptor subunit alpha [Nanoarchaeota archaeon]
MLESLGNALKKGIDKIAGAVFVDKKTIDSIIKDLQRALIEADVNVKLVFELTEKIKKAAIDEKIKGVEKKEQIVKIMHDELTQLLGGEKQEYEFNKKKQNVVVLVGLYGAGKTTTTAKLAHYYEKRGFKTAIVGLDVHRPAAREQLEQLGKQHKIKVFIDHNETDPIKIYKSFEEQLKEYNLVIVDTAGRHDLDKELVKEITDLTKTIKPTYSTLVMPADIGQIAKQQAEEFKKSSKVNSVIITRMDSTAKGGGALTACKEAEAGVVFITNGEKINDIEQFNPSAFISRLTGMGDLETLLDKVNSAIDKQTQGKLQKRLEKGIFTMDDFYQQLESMNSMGSLSKIAGLIPGLGKAKLPENLLGTQEDKMKKWKFCIQSMTPEEKQKPELIEKQTTRLQRIAKGSGCKSSDVRSLLKQYKLIKEFANSGMSADALNGGQLDQKTMQKLAKKFGKKMRI